MATPTFIKSFTSSGAIAPFHICAFTATDLAVRQAAAPGDPIAGVTDYLGANDGETVDLIQGGWGDVTAGGPIAAGDSLTSDANGCAVKAVVAAGSSKIAIGFAQKSAVAGDVFPFLVAQHVVAAP